MAKNILDFLVTAKFPTRRWGYTLYRKPCTRCLLPMCTVRPWSWYRSADFPRLSGGWMKPVNPPWFSLQKGGWTSTYPSDLNVNSEAPGCLTHSREAHMSFSQVFFGVFIPAVLLKSRETRCLGPKMVDFRWISGKSLEPELRVAQSSGGVTIQNESAVLVVFFIHVEMMYE